MARWRVRRHPHRLAAGPAASMPGAFPGPHGGDGGDRPGRAENSRRARVVASHPARSVWGPGADRRTRAGAGAPAVDPSCRRTVGGTGVTVPRTRLFRADSPQTTGGARGRGHRRTRRAAPGSGRFVQRPVLRRMMHDASEVSIRRHERADTADSHAADAPAACQRARAAAPQDSRTVSWGWSTICRGASSRSPGSRSSSSCAACSPNCRLGGATAVSGTSASAAISSS